MRARTARWVPRCAAAGSIVLIGAGLVLAYADRQLVPASLTGWTVSNVSGQVVNMAVPVAGFILASLLATQVFRIHSTVAVAAATLAAAALFNPARRRVQKAVDGGSTGPVTTPTRPWPRSRPG